MNPDALRIVFMGTPEFAAESLQLLQESQHEVAAVVTAPDKPSGRGRKMTGSAVKEKAKEFDLPIFQPEKLREETFIAAIRAVNADVFIVVAFRMLPKCLWSLPKLGTFNLHASLLPDLRGAAPIQWALWYGYERTGLTTFLIDEEIDTGKILLQKELAISPEDTAASLHDKLMSEGALLVLHTADAMAAGTIQPKEQPAPGAMKKAPKIFKSDTYLNCEQSCHQVNQQVRALSPYPGSRISVLRESGEKEDWKILQSAHQNHTELPPGMLSLSRKGLRLSCLDGEIEIHELQIPGKKPLTSREFILGWKGPELLHTESKHL